MGRSWRCVSGIMPNHIQRMLLPERVVVLVLLLDAQLMQLAVTQQLLSGLIQLLCEQHQVYHCLILLLELLIRFEQMLVIILPHKRFLTALMQ